MRLHFLACIAAALIVNVAPAAANICAIDRVVRGAKEVTILFQRSANYGYTILVSDPKGRAIFSEGEWTPYFVGINGAVLHERGQSEVQTRSYMRLPEGMTLVLSDHHSGCRADFTHDGQHLRIRRDNSEHLVPIEIPEQILSPHAAIRASPGERFQSIPAEQVLPLVSAGACGCIALPKEGSHTQENVLLSIGSGDGPALIRVDNETITLPRRSSSKGRKTFVNEYGDQKLRLITYTKHVNYEKVCNLYPDPPTEGSCFVGKVTALLRGQSFMKKIVQICGCP